jgi:hypothetical protein
MYLLVFLVSHLNSNSTICLSVELNLLSNKNQSIERRLLQLVNASLKQSATLVIGSRNKLNSDTLMIIMAHGFHFKPSQYERVESGVSFRLGDYYRVWVDAYVKQDLTCGP